MGILIGSTFAALIVIPTMLVFAWVYEPMIFVRVGRWVLRAAFCWPVWLCDCCTRRNGKVSDGDSEAAETEQSREESVAAAPVATIDVAAPARVATTDVAAAGATFPEAELPEQINPSQAKPGQTRSDHAKQRAKRAVVTTPVSATETVTETVIDTAATNKAAAEIGSMPRTKQAEQAATLLQVMHGLPFRLICLCSPSDQHPLLGDARTTPNLTTPNLSLLSLCSPCALTSDFDLITLACRVQASWRMIFLISTAIHCYPLISPAP